jgi:hypothetical protein
MDKDEGFPLSAAHIRSKRAPNVAHSGTFGTRHTSETDQVNEPARWNIRFPAHAEKQPSDE